MVKVVGVPRPLVDPLNCTTTSATPTPTAVPPALNVAEPSVLPSPVTSNTAGFVAAAWIPHPAPRRPTIAATLAPVEIELLDLEGPGEPARPSGRRQPSGRTPRIRTTLVVAVGLASVLLVVGGALQGMLRDRLSADRDRALATSLDRLESLTADGSLPVPVPVPAGDVAQILQSPGVVVASSTSVADDAPLVATPPPPGATRLETLDAPGPVRLRVASRALPAPRGIAGSTVLVAGTPLRRDADTVDEARRAYLGAVAALVLVAATLTWRHPRRVRPGGSDGSGRGDAQPARR
jgi:hypothetical protein